MKCGTVLYDRNYQFPKGQAIDKLLIALCEFGTDYLVFTTTSQAHSKKSVRGCQSADKPPSYFLPKGTSWFNEDTWVELHEVRELPAIIYNQKIKDGTITEYPDVLPAHLMRDILDCAARSDFIEEFYLDFLRKMRDKL